ncbi:acyltransferase family protein [Corynebacterium sp. Marseille-Q2823]|uniref:acyltransferase family protein n=1 Tax=Corynebacterium sp. Marseille-Q2823 TaxID=2736606 RepID=UPI0020CA5E06|nr:acyltransferase [Corynebacterium sp. Marseille-Q2823]
MARRSQPVGTPTSKQLKTPRPSREQRQAAQHDSAKNTGDIAVPKESATVTRQRRARLRPVPGLDGLRGLAVLAVVIYHFFGDLLPGGYLGVDMFFVLSGFLITSLLVREFAVTGRISLTDFWIRRFRRILPAALVVLCLCTALVAMIGGDLAVGIREQFLGTFFFVNNWTQIATSQTYFAPNEVQVFAHYWSLAVEEQFYLLWPLLMFGAFALSRRQPKRLPIALSLVLAVASAAAMALLFTPGEDPTRVYYGTDTHAFGLLIGALLSLLLTSTSKEAKADSWASTSTGVIAGTVGALALVGYLAQLVWMSADLGVTYRGGLVLTSLLGAAMIWGVVRETGPLTWLFRTRVMRWLGQRSFSLYLWHWPVVMILRELSDAPAWLLGLLALPLSFLLAEVTYQFVENPFRRAGYVATWRTYCFAPHCGRDEGRFRQGHARRARHGDLLRAGRPMGWSRHRTRPSWSENWSACPRPMSRQRHRPRQHRQRPRSLQKSALCLRARRSTRWAIRSCSPPPKPSTSVSQGFSSTRKCPATMPRQSRKSGS